MEELAILRHLIAHFQLLYDSSSSTAAAAAAAATTPFYPPSSSSSALPLVSGHTRRWCDEKTMEDEHTNLFKRKFGSSKPTETHTLSEAKKPRRKRCAKTFDLFEAMDEEIWRELPEDLLEAVIARLPISAFFEFRSVSRKWNSLLHSRSFLHHCTGLPRTQPWIYTITHENMNSGAIYDSFSKKWRYPPCPTLPGKELLLPAAFAGGLVCFLDIGHQHFYVCNPLTGAWKELPARSVRVWSRVAVAMTENPSGYKILWVGGNGDYEVYDSLKNSWTRPGKVPTSGSFKLPLALNFRSQGVSVGSGVYFLCSDPDGVVSYDTDSGIWRQFVIPVPPDSSDHCLAESGGRVMLVGLVSKNAATCVCVWELQRMTLLWKEVDRMPNVWCLEFYGKHVRMSCLGNKGLLMVSLRSRHTSRIVAYDVARRDWSRVPGCVTPRGRKRQWIAYGTAFYPCLTACP